MNIIHCGFNLRGLSCFLQKSVMFDKKEDTLREKSTVTSDCKGPGYFL